MRRLARGAGNKETNGEFWRSWTACSLESSSNLITCRGDHRVRMIYHIADYSSGACRGQFQLQDSVGIKPPKLTDQNRSRLGSSGIAENPLRPDCWQKSCGTLRTFVGLTPSLLTNSARTFRKVQSCSSKPLARQDTHPKSLPAVICAPSRTVLFPDAEQRQG